MTAKSRPASIVLSVAFLGIIWSVPLTQIGLQWSRGEPVQATDLLRRPPSVKNLRRFETDLEDQSWGQRLVRPAMQRLTFSALGDVGPKAVVGRDGWLFYRPGIRYLAEPNWLDLEQSDSLWVDSERSTTCRDNVVQAIVTFRDQLAGRGVKLLVVPVPGKASLYPDRVTRRIAADTPSAISPTVDLLKTLDRQGVATVDLLGDSFSRIYQTAEPASLGRTLHSDADIDLAADQVGGHVAAAGRATMKKRLLPGSAGLPSQLASELKAAVDYIISDGGAGTDVRRQLAVNPEIFDRKRVVIWQFAERDIHLGRHGWTPVPLPSEP